MPLRRETKVCKKCGRRLGQVRLQKCIICHSLFCRDCAVRRHGKLFCGQTCANVFFFGAEEDAEES